MIHNLYTDAMDSIKTTEDFKQRLIYGIQPRADSSFTIKKKGYRFRKACIMALTSLFIIAAGVLGGIYLNQNPIVNNRAGALPPHFTVGNRVYWTKSYSVSKLPSNYKPVGRIISRGSGNFQGNGVIPIGSEIYMDPTNPYAAYISNISTYIKGNRVLSNNVYELYVTQEIRDGSIYYNGDLYNFYIPIHIDPVNAKYIGTVRSVDNTRLPSRDFETNILNTLGGKVYLSETDKSILYVKQKDGGITYFKLNFH